MLRSSTHVAFSLLLPLALAACGPSPTPSATTAPGPYADGVDHSWVASPAEGQRLYSALSQGLKAQNFSIGLSITASNGWGPIELNTSNGETAAGDGRSITLKGRTYATGLGVHADSEIHIKATGLVTPACARFKADIGIDDEVGENGKYSSVVFQVYGDGEKLYDSGLVTGSTPTKSIDVPIGNKSDLRFVVTRGSDQNYYDHADWADPKVFCEETTTPPTGPAGSLDPSFNRIQTSANPVSSAVQPDGKILTFADGVPAEFSPSGNPRQDFLVTRYNVDGTPDTTFGTQGRVIISGGAGNTVRQIQVLPDGRIVAVGLSTFPTHLAATTYVTLIRLLPSGEPDPSFGRSGENFGQTGIVFTNAARNSSDFALQPDGKIVLVGGRLDDFGVLRFDVNGDLDTSFGQGGRVAPFESFLGSYSAVTVQNDGKIAAAGVLYIGDSGPQGRTNSVIVLARYLSDGSLDPSFDGDGKVFRSAERFHDTRVKDLIAQPDGELLLAWTDNQSRCMVERLNNTGSRDTGFTSQLAVFEISNREVKLALQNDGKVLASGCRKLNNNSEVTNYVLTRILPNGQPDPTFGGADGTVVEDTRNVLLQPDGKIIIGLNPIVRLFP